MDSRKNKRKNTIVKLLKRRIPLLSWLPQYSTDKAISDFIAGITVGLTLVPQGLAYGTLAGLEPQYGLYSSFVGCFVYLVFGSCKDINIGPTALLAVMTYMQLLDRNQDFVFFLCFVTGCVQILMLFLRLGILIEFISIPVSVGFNSATALIVVVSQLKCLLGLQVPSAGFLTNLRLAVLHLHEARLSDSLLGIVCFSLLIILRKVKDIKIKSHDGKMIHADRVLAKGLWILSTARNTLAVVLCSVIAYACSSKGYVPFELTGFVRAGPPTIQPPPFSTLLNNRTLGVFDMCYELGSAIVVFPVISILSTIMLAKAFTTGGSVDITQEIFTQGLINVLGSFVSAMPVTGSIARTAINKASGVCTPMSGLYSGLLVLLALGVLTPYFYYIPKATLSAVIISSVIFMIDYESLLPMWKCNKKDLIPTAVTFFVCLICGVEYGIIAGVGANIVLLLHPTVRPSIVVQEKKTVNDRFYLLVILESSLYFPAVDFLRETVHKASVKLGTVPVVVDCRYILDADFTAAKGIEAILTDLKKRKQPIYFHNARPTILATFKNIPGFLHFGTHEDLENTLQEYNGSQATSNTKTMENIELVISHDQGKQNGRTTEVYTQGQEPLLTK